jgi:hypothetical protein
VDVTGGDQGSEQTVHETVAGDRRQTVEGDIDHLDKEMDTVAARDDNMGFGKVLTQTSFDGGAGVGVHGSSSRQGRWRPTRQRPTVCFRIAHRSRAGRLCLMISQ